jgi:hypothetical protein
MTAGDIKSCSGAYHCSAVVDCDRTSFYCSLGYDRCLAAPQQSVCHCSEGLHSISISEVVNGDKTALYWSLGHGHLDMIDAVVHAQFHSIRCLEHSRTKLRMHTGKIRSAEPSHLSCTPIWTCVRDCMMRRQLGAGCRLKRLQGMRRNVESMHQSMMGVLSQ